MDDLKFTARLYGEFQFQHSVDGLELPDGFINYHKSNFSRYFSMPEERFRGLKVLETGCGPGKHAVVLALMGANVLAVDLSQENIERGERLKEYYKLDNLKFLQHDLMLPLEVQEEFDLISAHNWLQHSQNPSTVLKNLIPHLRLGGRVYLSLYHAKTFRFFTAQIARSVLKRAYFNSMVDLVKYHFPVGLSEFNNPDNIYLENIFDDYFVPYCNTTTYEIVIEDMRRLGCAPITPRPELGETYGLDNIPLRMGFEKRERVGCQDRLYYTKPVDEFAEPLPQFMVESRDIARKIMAHLNKENDKFVTTSFCLGLYHLRAAASRIDDARKKHEMLKAYLEMALSNSIRHISTFYDTQRLYSLQKEKRI